MWPVPPGKNQSACWMMGSIMPTICRDNVVIISVMFLQRRDKIVREHGVMVVAVCKTVHTARCGSKASWGQEQWPCCWGSSCWHPGTRWVWLRIWSDTCRIETRITFFFVFVMFINYDQAEWMAAKENGSKLAWPHGNKRPWEFGLTWSCLSCL